MRYVQISYYIASNNEAANKLANNMRAMLRRRAMHFDGSCWVAREDQIPHVMMHEMEVLGAQVFVTPAFEEDGAGVLNAMAVSCLIRDLNDRLASLGVSSSNADADLDKEIAAEKGETRRTKLKKYKARCRAAVRRLETFLEDAKAAAENLGFSIGTAHDLINRATTACGTLQSNFSARAAAYAAAASCLEDAGMREVALADEVPAEVVHDMLLDQGSDDEASNLAKTFAFAGVVNEVETVEYEDDLEDDSDAA